MKKSVKTKFKIIGVVLMSSAIAFAAILIWMKRDASAKDSNPCAMIESAHKGYPKYDVIILNRPNQGIAGHASVGLLIKTSKTAEPLLLAFGRSPDSASAAMFTIIPGVKIPGAVHLEPLGWDYLTNSSSIEIPISEEQFNHILRYIAVRHCDSYGLITHDCVTFVCEVADYLHLAHPTRNYGDISTWLPRRFVKSIVEMNRIKATYYFEPLANR